jgi:serine/threonine-protein kinase RsbW
MGRPLAERAEAGAGHDGSVTDAGEERIVRVQLPVDSRYIRVARLVAAGLASTAGFDVDAVDDFRIAVDELCAALLEVGDSNASVELMFSVSDGEVQVDGRTATPGTASFDSDRLDLSRQILDVACDTYTLSMDGTYAVFSARKHAR